jgi:hypothetical protein
LSQQYKGHRINCEATEDAIKAGVLNRQQPSRQELLPFVITGSLLAICNVSTGKTIVMPMTFRKAASIRKSRVERDSATFSGVPSLSVMV